MKRILSFISVFTMFASLSFAQEAAQPKPNPNAADIKFLKELHDFGTINQGDGCVTEFEFTNTGKEPLILQNVQASCGCTVPEWPRQPIMPGQKGKIKVTYDSKRVGPINKAITITSNAATPTKVINIKGNVNPVSQEAIPEKKPSMMNQTK